MDGGGLVSTEVGERDSMESPVVMGCMPVSSMTKTRSGALWRAPPPLGVLQMSWHAALWRLMRRALCSGHSRQYAYTSPACGRAGTKMLVRGRISWLICRYKLVRI